VLISLIARSLRKHPRLNAHLVGDEIRTFASVNIGVAVALDDGLIVPVLRGADQKSLGVIQSELQDLSERARAGSLRLAEIKGSTFTLSNLGMFGAEHFTAILNPPEVGILAIGAIQDTPVGVDGQLVLRPMLHMTLSADHRAVAGATAAVFLRTLKELLENPYLLLA
jgi:pyruvate dehydrogenase E2 component (dihydrolipoamide acetyltransferase)